MLPILLLVVFGLLCLLRPFLRLLLRQHRSPLRKLPGPPSPSFFLGNLEEMHEQENTNLVARWTAAYGPAFVYRGFVSGCRLMITDPLAVAHVLGNAYDYPKPDFVRDSLAEMVCGHGGLITVEGDTHRRQVRFLVCQTHVHHSPVAPAALCSAKSWYVFYFCPTADLRSAARRDPSLTPSPRHLPSLRPTSNPSHPSSGTKPPR